MLRNLKGLVHLKNLESRLHEQLQAELALMIPLKVSCLLREKTLTVLVHTSEFTVLSPQAILLLVKNSLAQDQHLSTYHLQTYLVVSGQNQPQTSISSEISVLEPQDLPLVTQNQNFNSHLQKAIFRLQKEISGKKSAKIFSLGLGISFVLGSLYLVTRPCVIGTCPNLAQAQQLAQNALNIMDLSSSSQEVLMAQKTLTQSINILQSIPPWSNYHTQAVTLLTTYQQQSEQLSQILQSLETANQAVLLAQNAPLSTTKWQKVQQLWQKTLIPLAKLPNNSSFYSFAQVKLIQYQNNLTIVQQQMQVEEKATKSLQIAKEAAKIAKAKQNAAQSLADWQSVVLTWQMVIQHLQEISPKTTVYSQAKPLLDSYLPHLVMAQSRQEQEQLAVQRYNQALQQAKLAEKSVQQKQWTAAVSYWQKSLANLQQIPQSSFYYNQAQPLIASYVLLLKEAEKNRQFTLREVQIQQDLQKICQNICHYQITENLIQIHLTAAYTQQVWQTAIQAQNQTNVKTKIDLLNHLAQLEKSLQIISNNTGKLVEVYNAEQVVIAVYEPKK